MKRPVETYMASFRLDFAPTVRCYKSRVFFKRQIRFTKVCLQCLLRRVLKYIPKVFRKRGRGRNIKRVVRSGRVPQRWRNDRKRITSPRYQTSRGGVVETSVSGPPIISRPYELKSHRRDRHRESLTSSRRTRN